MKSFLLTLVVAALVVSVAFSQNYELLKPGNDITYVRSISAITHRVIPTDSVFSQGTDTVYTMYHEPGGENCPQLDGPSWMGESIRKNEAGDYIFENLYEEEIIIVDLADKTEGEQWICWQNNDFYVKATISEIMYEPFLIFADSVKHISFQKYNSEGVAVSSNINEKKMKVSKHHQMIQTLPMVMFPDVNHGSDPNDGTNVYPQSGYEFSIAGMIQPKTGTYNITTLDIFDYQVGDEMHIVDHLNQLEQYNITDSAWMQYRVLNRNDGNDMVSYDMERIRRDKFIAYNDQGNIQDSTETIVFDTVSVIYQDDSYLNVLPYEVVRRHWNDDSTYAEVVQHRLYPMSFYNYGRVGKITAIFRGGWSWFSDEECMNYSHIDGCADYDYEYYEGLGGPYFYCSTFGGTVLRKLVYFHQGNQEWGEPLNILGTATNNHRANNKGFQIYPNPASNIITIEAENQSVYHKPVFYIMDVSGKQVLSRKLDANQTTLSTGLASGIYFYRIMNDEKTLKTGKLIIQ